MRRLILAAALAVTLIVPAATSGAEPNTWTDANSFTTLYGYGPQEYFNRVVLGDASGWRIPTLVAQVIEWQTQLAKLSADDVSGRGILETNINEYGPLIRWDIIRQQAARDFIAGKIGDYAPYLSNEGRLLIAYGLIDTTVAPAAPIVSVAVVVVAPTLAPSKYAASIARLRTYIARLTACACNPVKLALYQARLDVYLSR